MNIRGKFTTADKKGGLNSYHKKKCASRPSPGERPEPRARARALAPRLRVSRARLSPWSAAPAPFPHPPLASAARVPRSHPSTPRTPHRRYVWKLVYIHMLGYDVDFGHMEIISLLTSTKFSEKLVGYVATTLLTRASDDHFTLVINSIKNDLLSKSPAAQCLALACVSNMGTTVLAVECAEEVKRILVSVDTQPIVRKKASLCLLRFYRTNPTGLSADEWCPRISTLLESKEIGVVLSTMSLLLGLASRQPEAYVSLVPHVIHTLSRLAVNRQCSPDYLYYTTPCPWLQVKLLKFLQYYPPPAERALSERLNEVLRKVLSRDGGPLADKPFTAIDTSNRSNADYSILFEAIQLLIHHGGHGVRIEPILREQSLLLLARFISAKEPNPRYVGLQTMTKLAQVDGVTSELKQHQETVLSSLKEENADLSVRRRSLDLLFGMCDGTNTKTIVDELLEYVSSGEVDVTLREDLVLKVAIVAEKYAPNLRWYVDTILTLIDNAGDSVSDDIWHRVVQIMTNDKDLQPYAAERLFRTLQPRHVHATAVIVGAFVVGEFGYLIADKARE